MVHHELPEEVVAAFHTMWDTFPEPASLVHRSREVMAVNKAHYLEPGAICAKRGRGGPHTGCLANKALESGKAVVVTAHSPLENKELITYWLPLDGYPDYFIHLSVRFTVDPQTHAIALSPLTEEVQEYYGYDPATASR